ncbi:MAG: ATP-binding cassette domain-containing protein [Pseudomonadota bacterium]
MIALNNISVYTPGLTRRAPIVLDGCETFASRERVGILAAPGSGKSTLARVLSGIETPDAGRVRREGRVSWPIGFAGFLHPNLGVRDNLDIFARMTGLVPEDVFDFCDDFCAIPDLARLHMRDITPTQRALLAYACALSVPGPAMWIADEVITVGEPRERARCDALLSERLESGGLIFISRNPRQLRTYCDRYLVLIKQRLVACNDLDMAKDALELAGRHDPAAA